MSLVVIVAVLVCALCPWSLLLQYLCAPYVLGRSLLAASCCAPLSSCGNLRGGVLLVVGWRRRVKCVCYFYTRTHLNTKKKKKNSLLKSRCRNKEVVTCWLDLDLRSRLDIREYPQLKENNTQLIPRIS
jgi:hypothetical protein